MRIGAVGSGQPLGWRKDKNEPELEAANQNAEANSGDELVASGKETSGTTRPAAARMAASGGVPGGGVPGAASGAAGNTRTVMWKGKALNMDTTRTALAETVVDEAAQSLAVENAAAQDQQIQTLHGNVATILTSMDEMCGGLQEIYSVLHRISERDTAGERVFNTLHAELSDYKKDFIYEHLKPVVRPLLFLYDSLEQFEEEIDYFDSAGAATNAASSGILPVPMVAGEKSGVMPTRVVRQNTVYFREQLVEALRICEVTPMDDPNGVFNPRFHKAVKVVPVGIENDGRVLRVVRSGWFLNGQLLRPAEVEIGKVKS